MPRDHRDLRPAESPSAGNAALKAPDERRAETDKTLVGWKDICAVLCPARKARREAMGDFAPGLPVHRVPGSAGATVFAYEAELADWLRRGRSPAQDEQSGSGDVGEGSKKRFADGRRMRP